MGQYRPKQFFKEFENIYGDIQKEEVSPYEALKPEYDTTGYSKLFNKEKHNAKNLLIRLGGKFYDLLYI